MADEDEPGQSLDYLEALLEYLACPIDASSLTAIRDPDGQVVALRSSNGTYPVVNNVPCMIPELAGGADRSLALWQKRQEQMWQDHLDGDEGVFSQDNEITDYVGEIVAQAGEGLFLDVGCGALPYPGYMAAPGSRLRWVGIDPFFGDTPRRFPFAQAQAEHLPFRDQVFDGALYASTIYHLKDPLHALERARSVVRSGGKIYIWYEPCRIDRRYIVWKVQGILGWPATYSNYRWAFTRRSMGSMLERTGWMVEEDILLCARCPEFSTCPEPGEVLIVARRT